MWDDMEAAKCCICHGTLEGILTCQKCMAPIHSDCANFKGDGACGVTYGCDGSTTIDPKGDNKVQQSGPSKKDKDAQFLSIQAAYERVKRYQIQPKSNASWWHRIFCDTISTEDEIGYIAWRFAQSPPPKNQEFYPTDYWGFVNDYWGQCLGFWGMKNSPVSNIDNELVAARLTKGLLCVCTPTVVKTDERDRGLLISHYTSAYEQIVKDLIVTGRYDDAMTIARESEIEQLVKKATYCIGSAYQRIGYHNQRAFNLFIEGGHSNKIIEVVVNTIRMTRESMSDGGAGYTIMPWLDPAADYFRKNNDFKSLYELGKACGNKSLQNEAEAVLSRLELTYSMDAQEMEMYDRDPKKIAAQQVPQIEMTCGNKTKE